MRIYNALTFALIVGYASLWLGDWRVPAGVALSYLWFIAYCLQQTVDFGVRRKEDPNV